MKKLVVLFFLIPFLLVAQSERPLRIEFVGEDGELEYDSQLVGKDGVAVFYPTAPAHDDSSSWAIVVYDTNLMNEQVYQYNLPITAEYQFSTTNDGKLELLYFCKKHKKEPEKWVLVTFDVATQKHLSYDLDLPFETVHNMEVHGMYAIINGWYDKKEDFCVYNLNTKKRQFLLSENCTAEEYWVEFFQIDDKKQNLLVGLDLEGKEDGEKYMFMNVLDIHLETGAHEYTVIPHDAHIVLDAARMVRTAENTYMIMGVYSDATKVKSATRLVGAYSIVCKTDELIDKKTNKLSFESMHLSPFADLNLKKSGSVFIKSDLSYFNGRMDPKLHIGEAFYNNGKCALALEHYVPVYSQNGNSTTLDGYVYRTSIIFTYDVMGDVDNIYFFALNVPMLKVLESYTTIYTDEEQQHTIFCVSHDQITSMVYKDDEEVTPHASEDIVTLHQEDKVTNRKAKIATNGMEYWYGNSFLVSGYQMIKNKSFSGKEGKRWVYFISRVDYQ